MPAKRRELFVGCALVRVTINGAAHDVDDAVCVVDVLSQLSLPLDRVAVERNGVVLRKREHATTHIADGDVLEVVTLVGGG
jgi:thiamine biosynthesis protein ThiS